LGGGGSPMDAGVRARVEGAVGAGLGPVRVHTGPEAEQAARAVGARAFTLGRDVVLGAGESPTDASLLAHEATHVVQQTGGVGLLALMREEDEDDDSWIPDSVMEEIRDVVREIPGYALACAAVGRDLLSGGPIREGVGETVETLLVAGPFGAGVGAILQTMEILDSAVETIGGALADHNVTISRVADDIAAAWDRFEVSNLVDGNVAIVEGYIDRFIDDIKAAISDLVDLLLEAVRAAIVPLVEPLLADPAVAPVWDLATKVMGYNPLRGEEVRAPTVEILGDFLTLIGKGDVVAQMTERGTLASTAEWLDTQLATFADLLGLAETLFSDAWDAISPANLPDLLDTLPGLVERAIALFEGVAAFATTVIGAVLQLIKDSLLGLLSEQAHKLRGFPLLTVMLGRDPFDGHEVERSAENLIGGFIELVAGQDTYRQLAESGVIAEAAGRIEGAMSELGISWELITGTFAEVWDTMSLEDLLDPIGAAQRVIAQFGEPLARIISFAATVLQVVVELVLRLMNFPGDLLGGIISGVQQALSDIEADPIGFIENLLAALKLGFQQFFDNILTHLVQGLGDWLFRGLKGLGIEIPTELSGAAILQLVLDVLGLSVEFLWECLGEVVGPEQVARIRGAIDQLGEAWAFIKEVQEGGVGVLWERLSSQLGNLWDTILTMATDWLQQNLIEAAITKVLSMLDPTGVMAVVNSFIAFYRAVESVIEYVTEILQIVKTYVDTLAAIAAGNIAPGASMLETGLADAIPVAIGFLASQVGLGDVPEKVVEIINGLRQTIREAVIWLIRKALELGRAALDMLGLGGGADGQQPADGAAPGDGINEEVRMDGAIHHLRDDGPGGALVLHSDDDLVNNHVGKVKAFDDLVAAYNLAKTQAAKATAAKAIARWLFDHGWGSTPGGSAPGLGMIGRHGSKPPGLQPNPTERGLGEELVPLWYLQSEHVIPYTVIRGLGTVIGTQGEAARDVVGEDRPLTTIMIYTEASLKKNSREANRRDKLSREFVEMANRYWAREDAGEAGVEETMRRWVMRSLTRESDWYVDLTADTVKQEHAMPAGTSTRGAMRAEATPVPTTDDIKSAAEQELQDAEALVDEALKQLEH
ncbi:MAG: DUF4157 domain-containing protein, partial [Propionibacteriaceae bacterium]|nr:DUF4157 domain-containing protein [Propionibacteriaceae bacterium]